jgi:RimJ/RimL family protein N-acetyltransferase
MTVVLRVESMPPAPALLLRPWHDDDIEALIEVYRDPTLRRWTRFPVLSRADAVRWLEVRRRGWQSRQLFSFAVLAEQPGQADRLVANVVLKAAGISDGIAEVGYWTAADARGQGVAPRALEALTVWAFDTFAVDGLARLELLHQVDNPASCRVAEKTRYRFEQVMPARPPFPRDGHLHVRTAGAPA